MNTVNKPENKQQSPELKKEIKIVRRFFTITPELKYKAIIFILTILLLASLIGFGYIGYIGYRIIESQKTELAQLKAEKDTNIDGLKKVNDELTNNLDQCTTKNKLLESKVDELSTKLEQLRPKDIREVDYKKLKKINSDLGDFWLNPLYVDVNGDGRLDGIFSYKQGGTGEFLNIYVYAYLNGNNLTEILKAERYLQGSYIYLADQGILEITSEAGTPDSPNKAKSRFKWDPALNKMVLVKNDN